MAEEPPKVFETPCSQDASVVESANCTENSMVEAEAIAASKAVIGGAILDTDTVEDTAAGEVIHEGKAPNVGQFVDGPPAVEEEETAYNSQTGDSHAAAAYPEAAYVGEPEHYNGTVLPYDGSYDGSYIGAYGGGYGDPSAGYHHQHPPPPPHQGVVDGVYGGGHGGGYEGYGHESGYQSTYGEYVDPYQGTEYQGDGPPEGPSLDDGPPGLEGETDGPPGLDERPSVNFSGDESEQLPPPPPLPPGVVPLTVPLVVPLTVPGMDPVAAPLVGDLSAEDSDGVPGADGNNNQDAPGHAWEEYPGSHPDRQLSPKAKPQRDRSRSRSPRRGEGEVEDEEEVEGPNPSLPPAPLPEGGPWPQEYGYDGNGYDGNGYGSYAGGYNGGYSGSYDGSVYGTSAYGGGYGGDGSYAGYDAAYGAYSAPGMLHPATGWDQSGWATGGYRPYGAYGSYGYSNNGPGPRDGLKYDLLCFAT